MTRPPPRALKTKRLVLEAASPKHGRELWPAIEASLSELRPWMPWAEHASPDETRTFLREAARAWDHDTEWNFVVLYRGAPAGTVALAAYQPLVAGANLGYWIRTDLAGRGLMTEAASAVVEFGFKHLGLHRIELHAAPENVASIRVAEKLGFVPGGTLREASRGSAGFHDVYVFDLLVHDPRPRLH